MSTAHCAYYLVLVQLISTAADGTSLVLHRIQTLLIWANLSECYKVGSYAHLIDYN